MPTYAYVCRDCAHAFDAQQSFSDDALTTCPECGGVLRKQFGAVGVVFKGSGFYKTDSRDSGKKSTASTPASKDSATKESSTTKDTSTTTKSSDSSSSTSSTAGAPAKSASDGSAA